MSDDVRSWDCESWTLFTSPAKAVAEERDRGNGHPPRIRVRVWSSEDGVYRRKSLGMTVRDENGEIDSDLVAEMLLKGERLAQDLLEGDDESPAEVPAPRARRESGELTLKEGFRLAFRPKKLGGKYREGKYRKSHMRARDDLLRILSPARTWGSLRRSDYERIWETIAEVRTGERVWRSDKLTGEDGRGKIRKPGWRWCERMITALSAVGGWLEEEGHLEPNTYWKLPGWSRKLKRDWRALTGESTKPDKPRYTPPEAGRMLAALPDADPRLRLAMALGVEDRLGQVIRTRRSHLDLSPVGAYGQGRVDIVGRGNKRGGREDLYPEQRKEIDDALGPDGYLRGLEAAYQEGRRDDYPLFPQYAFRDGVPVAPMNAPDEPMVPRTLRDHYNNLEKMADVPHRKGRGWYGLRRLAADIAPEYTSDDRVLDSIGHWADSRTRASYQQAANPTVAGRAAQVRRQMRNDLRGKSEEEAGEPRAKLLRDLILASEPEVFGSLLQSLATLAPAKALEVLETVQSQGLNTASSKAALAQLEAEDLMPLLTSGDSEVRETALQFLATVG